MKKIAKSCRPLISEDQFRNRGADIMLIKSSSVAKSRIGTFTKCQLNARIRRRRISRAKRQRGGVCESQRRARAKRKAYDDDPKVAAAEDFPKRQMIEIHVQMDIHVRVSAWHCSPFSWEAAAPSGMDAAFVRRSRSFLLFPLAPCSCRLSNGHTEQLHRSALAPTSGTSCEHAGST